MNTEAQEIYARHAYRLDGYLGRAVRGAREAEGITQSELARRAGVSPSVINRIESGAVKAPDPKTTDRIAVALGRSDRILYWLGGNEMTWWVVDELALPELQAARDDMERAWKAYEASGTVDDVPVWDAWKERIHEIVVAHFVGDRGLDAVPVETHHETRELLEDIALALRALTPGRRQRVINYVHDQARLSEADRRRGGDAPQTFFPSREQL